MDHFLLWKRSVVLLVLAPDLYWLTSACTWRLWRCDCGCVILFGGMWYGCCTFSSQRGPRSQAAHTQNMPSCRRCIWNDSTARSSHHPADMTFLSWHQWCEKEGSGALLWSWWRFICPKNPLFLSLNVNWYISGRSGSGFPAHSEAICGCGLILRSWKRSTIFTYWASQFKDTTNTFASSSLSRLVPSNDFSSSWSPSVPLPCFHLTLLGSYRCAEPRSETGSTQATVSPLCPQHLFPLSWDVLFLTAWTCTSSLQIVLEGVPHIFSCVLQGAGWSRSAGAITWAPISSEIFLTSCSREGVLLLWTSRNSLGQEGLASCCWGPAVPRRGFCSTLFFFWHKISLGVAWTPLLLSKLIGSEAVRISGFCRAALISCFCAPRPGKKWHPGNFVSLVTCF